MNTPMDFIILAVVLVIVISFALVMYRVFRQSQREDLSKSLLEAVVKGDLEQVLVLLKKKADVEFTTESDHYLRSLMVASALGNMEMVKTLLYADAGINAETPEGVTALLYAVHRGQVTAVECLVERGAEINHADQMGNTSVMVAILKRDMSMIRFLIEKGADVNARSGEEKGIKYYHELGQNPRAGYTNNPEDFPDADPSEDESGEDDTPSSGMETGPEDIQTDTRPNINIIYLYYKDELSRRYRYEFYWRPPLWLAIDFNDIELIALLLKNKADFNWVLQNSPPEGPMSHGVNILMYAAYVNNCDVLDRLIKAGMDVNNRKEGKEGGKNALYYAIEGNAIDAVRLLYKAGADHIVNTFPERTALMKAMETPERHDMIQGLLDLGETINGRTGDGGTVLMTAAGIPGNMVMVRWLTSEGANVNDRTKEGETALMRGYATPEILQILMSHGADVNAKTTDGRTALYECVVHGEYNSARLLIERGADVNAAESKDGKTCLMEAVKTGNYEITGLLLDHGADIYTRDKIGRSALQYAGERNDVPGDIMEKFKQ